MLGCGFKVIKGGAAGLEQGPQTPLTPVPSASISNGPSLDTLLQDQTRLKKELSEVKQVLSKEKALNAKRYEYLLHAISALTAKLSTPPL